MHNIIGYEVTWDFPNGKTAIRKFSSIEEVKKFVSPNPNTRIFSNIKIWKIIKEDITENL